MLSSAEATLEGYPSQLQLNFSGQSFKDSLLLPSMQKQARYTDLCMPDAPSSDPCHELGTILDDTDDIVAKVNENVDDVSDSLLLQLEEQQKKLDKTANQEDEAFQNVNPQETISKIETIDEIVQKTGDQAKVVLEDIIKTEKSSSTFVTALSVFFGVVAFCIIAFFVYSGYKNEFIRRQMKMMETKAGPSEEVSIDIPNVNSSLDAVQTTHLTDPDPTREDRRDDTSKQLPTFDTKVPLQPVWSEPWPQRQPRPILAPQSRLQPLSHPVKPVQQVAQAPLPGRRPLQKVPSYAIDNHAPRYQTEHFEDPGVFRNSDGRNPTLRYSGDSFGEIQRTESQQPHQSHDWMTSRGVRDVPNSHQRRDSPRKSDPSERKRKVTTSLLTDKDSPFSGPLELPRAKVNTLAATRNLNVRRPAHYDYSSS